MRIAQTGRILSQFEQRGGTLRHCSACIEFRHDKGACQGCRSTGHTRSNYPTIPRVISALQSTVAIQYGRAAEEDTWVDTDTITPSNGQQGGGLGVSIGNTVQDSQFGADFTELDPFADEVVSHMRLDRWSSEVVEMKARGVRKASDALLGECVTSQEQAQLR